ncbi:MAG: NAD(P)-binding domain-containing protein [Deltaproteobacteria bacterium]|nr:NAD(P)-binding domain-containing protein [Deltaproteobacteria bacterium]
MNQSKDPVCIIGAGPSGLAACKVLAEAGIAFECLEAGRSVGGVWDVEGGYGGGYRSLHTNTSTQKMAYSDFPFPDDSPQFPNHSQMLDYFNAYAEHFKIRDRIQLNCRVESANPLEDGRWQIRLESGETRDYAACIVATGQYGTRRWPEPLPPGHFDGDQIHASDYLDPTTPLDCRDKRVVVVGLGSSAAEIATELAGGKAGESIASRVILSARSGRYIMPKVYKGEPLDSNAPHPTLQLPAAIRWLPRWARLHFPRSLMKKAFARIQQEVGGPTDWNLPDPAFPPWAERPTLSDGFIPALQAGRVEGKPGISAIDGSSIKFTDGSVAKADVVIYATGYRFDFPFLDRQVLGCESTELSLYQRVAHPSSRNLYFIGFTRVLCSLWPVSEQQAIWLAGVLTGSIKLPSEAERTRRAVQVAEDLPVFCNFYVLDLRADEP